MIVLAQSSEALTPPPSFMVFFDSGSAQYRPQDDKVLRQVVSAFQMHQDPVRVRIFAHTDGTEARSLSSALSSMRGETVKNRLVALGIPTDLIQIVIYGASQPLVPSKLDETEVQNRRVEIVLERLRP
jgi:outer membrane protein OmpA-like peptidoglycan-associated protein